MSWRPTASLAALRKRAQTYRDVRQFFFDRGVLEVETPLLGTSTATDPHLFSFEVPLSSEPQGSSAFLHTSPEMPMKRLLAAGSGDIYQICKTFRKFERGARHNPEFTMLEWYRVGFTLQELIEEVNQITNLVLGQDTPFQVISYRQVFLDKLGLDPFLVSDHELQSVVSHRTDYSGPMLDRDGSLDLLLCSLIEPDLGVGQPTFLTDYPASQASLSQTQNDAHGNLVAKRFELYLDGIEIANGYQELSLASELRTRFETDNVSRKAKGDPVIPIDRRFLEAMESGLPDCAGVALGLDRLLMIAGHHSEIDDVLTFPFERS